MADYSGFGALGAALAGGGPTQGHAFTDQLSRNYRAQEAGYDVERARELAGMERLQRIAQEGLRDKVLAAYGQNPQGDLVAQIMGANTNPSLSQAGPLAELAMPGRMDMATGAAEALQAGDYPRYNALNAGVQGKSFEPVRDLGDVLVSSGAALDAPMRVNPRILADIEAKGPKLAADVGLANARRETEEARQDRLRGLTAAKEVELAKRPPASITEALADPAPTLAPVDGMVAADPFAAMTAGVPMGASPVPEAPDPYAKMNPADAIIAEANAAIKRGKNPALVEKRMKEKLAELGYTIGS